MTEVLNHFRDCFQIHGLFSHEESGNFGPFRGIKKYAPGVSHSIRFHEFSSNGVVRNLSSRDDWSKIRCSRMAEIPLPKPKELLGVRDVDPHEIPSKCDPLFGKLLGFVQKGGRSIAEDDLSSFLEDRGEQYLKSINPKSLRYIVLPTINSPYLGELVGSGDFRGYQKKLDRLDSDQDRGLRRNISAFRSRLMWRCHFVQKIESRPDIESACIPLLRRNAPVDSPGDSFKCLGDWLYGLSLHRRLYAITVV